MKKYLTVFLFFVFLFGIFSCSLSDKKPAAKKNTVLVSLPPYGYVIEKIAGPTLTVKNILPLGANLHDFEPTAKDLNILLQSDIWFSVGEVFEDKIQQALSNTKNSFIKSQQERNPKEWYLYELYYKSKGVSPIDSTISFLEWKILRKNNLL